MDLREALKWCQQNPNKELCIKYKQEIEGGPRRLRMDHEGVVQARGDGHGSKWIQVIGWWSYLTDPDVSFEIPPAELEIWASPATNYVWARLTERSLQEVAERVVELLKEQSK